MRSFTGWDKVRALKIEDANFNAAFGWAFGSEDPFMIGRGLQIACNMKAYYQFCNLYLEGVSWLKKGLALVDAKDEQYIPIRAKAFYCAADLSYNIDNNLEASIYAKESINLFKKCKDPELPYLGHAMLIYGKRPVLHALIQYADRPDFLESEQLEEMKDVEKQSLELKTIAILEKSGERWDLYASGRIRCEIEIEKKDHVAAMASVEHFRTICLGTEFGGFENAYLAQIARAQGDFSKSLIHYQKMIDIFRISDFKLGISATYINMGDCSMELGQVDQAQRYFQEALTNAREFGAKWQFTYSLHKLGEICLSRGEYRQAGEFLLQGLTLSSEVDPDILTNNCLIPLLQVAEEIVSPVNLACLLGSIHQLLGDHPWPEKSQAILNRISATLPAKLGSSTFQSSLEAGRQMSREQVQAEALAIARQIAEEGKS
jgi:tetratricopeptide (TPR) repeat protein